MKRGPAPTIKGKTSFVQYVVPTLESYDYRLQLRQEIRIDGGLVDTLGEDIYFAVSGERFSIADSEILSLFPPRGTQGEYSNVLPHIAFTRPTLPWERQPATDAARETPDLAPRASWLALLVVDAEALTPRADGEVLLSYHQCTLHDLIDPPSGVTSYPDLKPAYGETPQDPCSYIDIDLGLFGQIAPSLADLQWLAHVRAADPTDSGASPSEQSVVFANRLPAQGRRSIIYLVSLDAMGRHLPVSEAATPPPSAQGKLRLAVLKSWDFECLREDRSFAGVVGRIGAGVFRLPGLTGSSDRQDQSAQAVRKAVQMGYAGLNHQLRGGDHSVSWYRGPFATYPVPPFLAGAMPLASADAALSYDPATGLLDSTYAAAWQLGRMLALQSQAFSTGLLAWKQAVGQAALLAWEERFLAQRIAPEAAPSSHPEAPGPSAADAARRRLKALLLPGAQRPAGAGAGEDAGPAVRPRPSAVLASALASQHRAGLTPAMPRPLIEWLDRLGRLHGVPFLYLVPYAHVLPPESIRFFHLDPNWIDCLLDGALGLGGGGIAAEARTRIRAADGPPVTGFLLRSQAVHWWPGLQCSAYGNGTPLENLRFERLSDDVMLCLVNGPCDTVDLHEPAEGIHFGVDIPPTNDGPAEIDPDTFLKRLRNPADGTAGAGTIPSLMPYYRSAATDGGGPVLAIDSLKSKMQTTLGSQLTAAEFALEMVQGVGLVRFQILSTEPGNG